MRKIYVEALKQYQSLSLPLKAGIWFTIANFLQRGLTMLTTPIFTRLLSKEQFGLANTYTAWQNVLTLVVTLSLYKAMMNLFKDYEDHDRITSVVSSLSIFISLAWILFGLIFLDQLSVFLGISKVLTVSLLLSFIPQAIINCWAIKIRYQYDYKICIIQSLVTMVLSTFIAAFCVWFIEPTVEAKTIPQVVVSAIVALFIYVFMLKKSCAVFDSKIWRFSLSFCVVLLPHYLSEFILQSSDKLMINAMCGSADVAIYSIAYSVGSLIVLVISAINNTIIPYRYQRLKDNNYNQLAKVSNQTLALVGVALLGIMIMSPEIIYIFGGQQYEEANYIVVPICIGVYFNFVFQLFSTVQEFYEKKLIVVIASVLCATTNIALNYIFIPLYGYQAAAYTTMFCYMLFSFVHYLFYRMVCKEMINGKHIYDIKGVLLISVGVIICGCIIAQINGNSVIKYSFMLAVFIAVGIIVKRYLIKKTIE